MGCRHRVGRGARGRAAALGLLWAAACGGELALRPLEVEVVGLSSDAAALTVKLALPDRAPSCSGLDPAAAAAAPAEREATWTRDAAEPRTLTLEPVEAEAIRVIAVALDADAAPLQAGCLDVDFRAIERPEVEIILSAPP